MTVLVDHQLPLVLLEAFSKILPELRDMLTAGDAVIELR